MKSLRFAYILSVVISLVLCGSLSAQTEELPSFEVASIKQAPPLQELVMEIQSGKRGVDSLKATVNDARVDIGYIPLNNLIMMGFEMKEYQIVGPDWMPSQAFTVRAKIPEGGSKEQVPGMIQSLLKERFKLATHRGTKEVSVYALTVSKDGHKMTEVAKAENTPKTQEEDAEAPPADPDEQTGSDTTEAEMKIEPQANGMVLDMGEAGQLRMNVTPDRGMVLEFGKMNMDGLAEILSQFMDRPVVNKTELKDFYEISLEIPITEVLSMAQRIAPKYGIALPPGISGGNIAGATPDAGGFGASLPSGGGLFNAVEKLGLKLDEQKAPVETLVIDHIE
ncbi:MAG: TIGR03435 family protein, partial [Acidobacteriota bacterium]